MFCPRCGETVDTDHTFCHACGMRLSGPARPIPGPARARGMLRELNQSEMRFFAYGIGGLLAVLLLAEVVRAVAVVALPLVIVLAILYWARERRRRYYPDQ